MITRFHSPRRPGGVVLSEYYHLRRTAIKDIAAYCGFVAGFLGSAPFAWPYLAAQVDAGSFTRGLWYFLALVIASGVACGAAGLAVGFGVGWAWEQGHRYFRNRRSPPADPAVVHDTAVHVGHRRSAISAPPRLTVVHADTRSPADLTGHCLDAVRFSAVGVELTFGNVVLAPANGPIVHTARGAIRPDENGYRDALCALIGAPVTRTRSLPGGETRIRFAAGVELSMKRGDERLLEFPRHRVHLD